LHEAVTGRPAPNAIERALAAAPPDHVRAADVGLKLAALSAASAGLAAATATIAEH
jgi:hypothetical protein